MDTEPTFDVDAWLARPGSWGDVPADRWCELVLAWLDRGGGAPTAARGMPGRELYEAFVGRVASDGRRACIEAFATERGPGRDGDPAEPFRRLIFLDPDPAVTEAAAAAFAERYRPRQAPPLAGAEIVARIAKRGDLHPEIRASIYRGLLSLGDARLRPYVERCWRNLPPVGCHRLAAPWVGRVTVFVVDFYLAWLESNPSSPLADEIATTLGRLPETAPDGEVVDLTRAFAGDRPRSQPEASGEGRPARPEVHERWSFEAYRTVIEPRVKRLVELDRHPIRLLPLVRGWGLDAAALDDVDLHEGPYARRARRFLLDLIDRWGK